VFLAVVPTWPEIAGETHPTARVFIGNKTAKKQFESGADTAALAQNLRIKAYCEPWI
jgi:hypothetical protein